MAYEISLSEQEEQVERDEEQHCQPINTALRASIEQGTTALSTNSHIRGSDTHTF